MKKTLLFALAASVIWFACDTNKLPSYTINAEIVGPEDSTLIFFQQVVDGKMEVIDSAYLSNSKVSFTGVLEQPNMIYLRVGDTRKAVNVFAENSQIDVRVNVDSLENAVVTGSTIHDELMDFKSYLAPLDEKSAELSEQYREASASSNSERMELIIAQYDELRIEQVDMIKKFVASKSSSYIAPFIIQRYLSYDMTVEELDETLASIDTSIYNSTEYIDLIDRVTILKSVAIGMPAVDFALNDTTGNPIAISAFKGKFLLIDFWASWCGPCRRENPNVVKLYNDFSDKGFEIIGVSFDEDRGKWIKAIQDDELTWPHVSDLKGWGSAAGKLYAVKSIPATVLLDRDGNIVAKNLRGDALREKLEELYAVEAQNS